LLRSPQDVELKAVIISPNYKCPKCGFHKVRYSKPRLVDNFLKFFFIIPYRCRGCRIRFHGFRRELSYPHGDEMNAEQGQREAAASES